MGDESRLVVTTYGAHALDALGALVRRAKQGEPLAPVDVVVPSAVAGVTLRRRLADPGLANVRFGSMPQLAERLAARRMALDGLHPLTAAARGVAVRAALTAHTGPLSRSAHHTGTVAVVERVLSELDAAGAAGEPSLLQRLRAGTARGAELADLYTAYRRLVGDVVDPAQLLQVAAEAVLADEAPPTQVVVHAPRRRLTGPERAMLAALAGHGRLAAVVAVTGDADADVDARADAAWLADLVGPPADGREGPCPPATPGATAIELAPDPDEEVRVAVRRVLVHLAGHPTPDRVAIAYRSPVPYLRLLEEHLTAAGVPHHVPTTRTLAGSVAGRTVLGLLDLQAADHPRAEVIRWLGGAPVLDADGRPVPAARWDRLSREAGVSRGLDAWHRRLQLAERELQRQIDDICADASARDPQRVERIRQRAESTARLRAFVDALARAGAAVRDATTWAEAAGALGDATVRFLGDRRRIERWGDEVAEAGTARSAAVERAAYDAVLRAVAGLAELDGTDAVPSLRAVREALAAALDRPLGNGTTLGRGVVVAPIRDLAGADVDLLVVVGMAEGSFPPRLHQDPVLRDEDREAAGLVTVEERRRSERRDYLAALAGARRVVLTSPRADTRAQRAQLPSPWLMETVARLHGAPVATRELTSLRAPWLTRHDSFVAALRETATPMSTAELDVALAMAGRADDLDDPRFRRGRAAVEHRGRGRLGEWTGAVGPLQGVVAERAERRLSATSLEAWATCPLRFYLRQVLDVRELDDPGDADTIEPRDKGTLVHQVLERFLAEALPSEGRPAKAPDEPWTAADIRRARDLLDEEAGRLEAVGRTGRPLLWRAQLARMHRQLARILSVDNAMRAARRAEPVAVEMPFGRDGAPPLTLSLPRSGEVSFSGSVDRVDRTETGGLVVTDYKTGKGYGYDAIPRDVDDATDADLLDRGRKIQLVLYALAARQAFGDEATTLQAYYWFVEQGRLLRGATIGAREVRRLVEVLDTAVTGIRRGLFPARPGEWDAWSGFDSCRMCPYDRVCPSTRAEQWAGVKADPALADYVALAEGPLPPAPEPEVGPARCDDEEERP